MNASPEVPNLVFLKLGGSLITEKSIAHTPRPETIRRLAGEIAAAWRENPSMRLLIGNGAGSFGHVPAQRYGTRQGVHTPEQWQGFVEVWRQAAALNHIVIDALHDAGLPVISLPPSASVTAEDGRVWTWELSPLRMALDANLIPVIYGDVIFDRQRGGTIFSTEDLFGHLARYLKPQRILLAGIEEGVWADYPSCTQIVKLITPQHLQELLPVLGGANADDVTGGMASKVLQSLELVEAIPSLEIVIFSGEVPGQVTRALTGGKAGTLIRANA